jgi:hypothetical protein
VNCKIQCLYSTSPPCLHLVKTHRLIDITTVITVGDMNARDCPYEKSRLVTYFIVPRIKVWLNILFSFSWNISKAKHVSRNYAPFSKVFICSTSVVTFFLQLVAAGYFRSHFINVTKQVLQIITSLRARWRPTYTTSQPAVLYHVSNTKCPFLYMVNRNPVSGIQPWNMHVVP